MLIYLIFLVFNPLSLDMLFRGLSPIIWTIIYLNEGKYTYILILNTIFLLMLITFDILLLRYIFLKRKELKIKLRKSDKFLILSTASLTIAYLLLFRPELIAILGEGGSNAIVIIGEQEKTSTWLVYGLVKVLKAILTISLFFLESLWLKLVYVSYIILFSILAGKKGGLISLLLSLIIIHIIYKGIPKINILDLQHLKIYKKGLKIFIIFSTSILFAIAYLLIQYVRTEFRTDVNVLMSVLTNISKFPLLIYTSSTIYLDQLFKDGGIELSGQYSAMLGDFGFLKYFLNPFTKFIFGSGIDFAIGPFLTNVLYGYNLPLGVNPTLMFEMVFIFGDATIGFLLSILTLTFIFFLQKKLLKVMMTSENLYFSSSAYLFLIIANSFKYDTLNSIRGIPFAIIPLILYYVLKIVPTKRRLVWYENRN